MYYGERLNSISHLVGSVFALVALGALLALSIQNGDPRVIVGYSVFGLTLVLLYTMSTLYHSFQAPGLKRVFKVLDHISIYLLIAGTYTPFMLISVANSSGSMILSVVWGLAVVGIISEILLSGTAVKVCQLVIYLAMGWDLPTYAHIPLIHGPDGKKMSKRHGATGVEEYQALGYSAAGMRNYLARLGWSHGDDEFFTDAQAQSWFDLEHIGKSPARFDFKKLANISGQHIAQTDDAALLHELEGYLAATQADPLSDAQKSLFLSGAYCVKERAKTMPELIDKSSFILQSRPLNLEEKALLALDSVSISILKELTPQLQNAIWTREELEGLVERLALSHETKMGKLAAPLRAALSGRVTSPSVFDMMLVLGRDETIARLNDIS